MLIIEEKNAILKKVRRGLHTIWWKPFMVEGAIFSKNGSDIPMCPTTADKPPERLITYSEALEIYRKELRKGNKEFHNESFVCFYEDDYKFDSVKGIWFRHKQALKILRHFEGIITPDFSTYQDFPDPLKRWNTYRMRAFGHWYGAICGGKVINNVRGGTPETWSYCFEGIPKNSIVAIGTVASDVRDLAYRPFFEQWLREMVFVLEPDTILVYGSANYECFNILRNKEINIIAYPSRTAKSFAGGKKDE